MGGGGGGGGGQGGCERRIEVFVKIHQKKIGGKIHQKKNRVGRERRGSGGGGGGGGGVGLVGGVRVDVNAMLGVGGDVGYGGCEPRIEGIVQCTKR